MSGHIWVTKRKTIKIASLKLLFELPRKTYRDPPGGIIVFPLSQFHDPNLIRALLQPNFNKNKNKNRQEFMVLSHHVYFLLK